LSSGEAPGKKPKAAAVSLGMRRLRLLSINSEGGPWCIDTKKAWTKDRSRAETQAVEAQAE